jgi:hypothetical protein
VPTITNFSSRLVKAFAHDHGYSGKFLASASLHFAVPKEVFLARAGHMLRICCAIFAMITLYNSKELT